MDLGSKLMRTSLSRSMKKEQVYKLAYKQCLHLF